METITAIEKLGAGLLFCCQGQVLLLLRAGDNNANTWGLPGGNSEPTDGDLLTTAKREATEEIGGLPEFTVTGQIRTRRGKHGQKHYVVFVASVSPEVKEQFKPVLNHEHTAWQWFDLAELPKRMDLHPVVHIVLHTHKDELEMALP